MNTSRPGCLVVVAGTATEVGKTWVAAAMLRELVSQGRSVAARKPAQSYDDLTVPTDADVLSGAGGGSPHDICPAHRWYSVAMAPPMAAEALGHPPILLADLLDELRWPEGCEVGLVESAGGAASPLAEDAHTGQLVEAVAPDAVILVADPGLGTISNVRLCHEMLSASGPEVLVLLNRFDATNLLHEQNRRWLAERDRFTVFTSVATIVASLDA